MAGAAAAPDRQVAEAGAPDQSKPGRARRLWIGGVAALVVVALAVLALLQVLSIRRHDDLESRRRSAVDAASNEVISLLTVSDATASADISKLLAGATAGFHDQLEQEAKSFATALTQGKVTSTGSVAAAALVSLTATKAVIAIAARATVHNSASPSGEARSYRLTVTVQRVSGRWLVSGLTFVV